MKPSENKSTRLCRHNLLRVSVIKSLGGHDDSLDADENLEFRRTSAFISHRDFAGEAVEYTLGVHVRSTRSWNTLWEHTLGTNLEPGLPECFCLTPFTLSGALSESLQTAALQAYRCYAAV